MNIKYCSNIMKLSFSNYTSSTFSKFIFSNNGDTLIINEIIKILESKNYIKVNTKALKSKQYYIGHNGYELIFKDVRYDVIYYIRQGDNNKLSILSHTSKCYWWNEYYIYRKYLTNCGTRNYQIPTNGYIEQNKGNILIVIKKFNKLIHKNPF